MAIFDWLKKNGEIEAGDTEGLRMRVIQALRDIFDPEIPVNIYDLGLIYALDVSDDGAVQIRMTLTSAACPVAQTFPETVECAVNAVPGVTEASVELVWDPPWSREMMSETARLELGML
jgi:FeS assembly SUF system protein